MAPTAKPIDYSTDVKYVKLNPLIEYLKEMNFGSKLPDGSIFWEYTIDPRGLLEKAKAETDPKKKKALTEKQQKEFKIFDSVSLASAKFLFNDHPQVGGDVVNATQTIHVYLKEHKNTIGMMREMEKSAQTRLGNGCKHTYMKPHFYGDIATLLADEASCVLWFVGPSGCGKTVLVENIVKPGEVTEAGFVKYQINCHPHMDPSVFFGEPTITIDPESRTTGNPQSIVTYKEGVVVAAMRQGLDEHGNVIPGQPAGMLFIDEASSLPAKTAIALNNMLEGDNPVRCISLEHESGRKVFSHPGFRIIFSSNTNGRGTQSLADAAYTAQGEALDASLLNRITATFRFGYDRDIEDHIILEKLGTIEAAEHLKTMRNAIRDSIAATDTQLSTPFSTRNIVQICNLFRVFRSFEKAFYLACFEQLTGPERAVYNELAASHITKNILQAVHNNSRVDHI
jgi:MoxR-like ATPase